MSGRATANGGFEASAGHASMMRGDPGRRVRRGAAEHGSFACLFDRFAQSKRQQERPRSTQTQPWNLSQTPVLPTMQAREDRRTLQILPLPLPSPRRGEGFGIGSRL